MRFAINQDNLRIEVSKSGERAICPDCESTVIGNFGKIRPKYWRHIAKDCDNWYEPMTEWHLNWQNQFPKINQEVIMSDIETGIKHRADIRLHNGLVIEVQNSPISNDEIKQREKFYGKENLIWVINGNSLAKSCHISYRQIRKIFSFTISLPFESYDYKQYSIDEIKAHLYECDAFLTIYRDKDISYFGEKMWDFKFTFEAEKDFKTWITNLEYEFKSICVKLYGFKIYETISNEFKVTYTSRRRNSYEIINFSKKYWRTFLNEMEFPIFIDHLPGLENHLLFWYQKNKIVSKQNFLNKYLRYT